MADKKNPSEEVDIKTLELMDKNFKESETHRETLEGEWREYEDFYDGNQWKNKNLSFKNLIFPLIEQEVAVLSDSLPSTDLLSRRAEREDDTKMLEASVHFTLEQQAFFLKVVMAIRASLKMGTGFHYIDFDPDADNGQGMTTIKTIPWSFVYIDPAATDIDEASFVGFRFPTRLEDAKRKFPKFKDKIKATGSTSSNPKNNTNGMSETKANYVSGGSPDSSDKFKLDDMVSIEEAWIKDYEMIEIPEEETQAEIAKETEEFFKSENPDITRFEDHAKHIEAHKAQLFAIASEALGTTEVTPQDIESLKEDPELGIVILMIEDHIAIHEQYLKSNPENKRPKFENHLRLIIKVGNVIVYDGNPPVNDGMVPLVPYYCYKDEKSCWGTGEVKNILPSQKSFNEMDNAEYESLHLTANPGWITEVDSGVDPGSISNKRGKVYVLKKNALFKRLEPGTTSPQLSIRKQSDQQFMQIITGLNEASQGRQPGGITAAKAIERLQQQTNGRIRLKANTLALYSMPRLGKLIASRNAKYWTTERFMRVSDPSTGKVDLIKFSPEQVRDLEYDVRVTQGSLAGTDKEAQAEVMAAYVEKGWIPPKVYFQIIDVPNKKRILEALEEADQQNAMLQQLSQENEQLKQMLNGGGVPQPPMMPPEAMQEM